MKQKLTFLLALFLTTSLSAQVTIGSGEKPNAGALLDLKQEADGSSKGGLGLPCVELQAYAKLKMGATATDLTAQATEHTGMVVYNIADDAQKCDPNYPTSGLHVWDGSKWVGIGAKKHATSPPDYLSEPIYLPNAYMVTTIGATSSVTIPVAKAFAAWEFLASEAGGKKLVPTPFAGALSVAVEWEEALAGGNNDIIGTPTLSTTSLNQSATITVATTGNPGNAVVSLSDATGVRWSWHIWVTATPATISYNNLTWMDRNVGATSATPGDDGTIGLYYQWGRHTPMPGFTQFNETRTTVPIGIKHISIAQANDGNSPAGQNTLAYAIAHPLAFINNYATPFDWYSNLGAQWDTRWLTETIINTECPAIVYAIPAITNPCPAGWKVPAGTNNHTISPWMLRPGGYTWNKGYDFSNTPVGPAGYYPAAGYRASGTAYPHSIDHYGQYWSASPKLTNASYLHFSKSNVDSSSSQYRAEGSSVRCVQD